MAVQYAWEVRAEVLSLLLAGVSSRRVEQRCGVSDKSVKQWARDAGLMLQSGRHGGAVQVGSGPVSAPGSGRSSYRRLSLEDRSFIQAGLAASPPLSVRRMATELAVSPSTVSREISAHQVIHDGRQRYHAGVAHQQAMLARPRPRSRKLDDPWLRLLVKAGLTMRFSPEQIAALLRRRYPGREDCWVSHETIYQALYVQGKGSLREELRTLKALRSGRTRRKPQSRLPGQPRPAWLADSHISHRPAVAEDRAVPGFWEGDLVVGPNKSGLVTLIERTTRYSLLGQLGGDRTSATVTTVLQQMIQALPGELVHSITWDQGREMTGHPRFTIATGVKVYFCDPHSPWQRPSNENLNGLVRDFYPKGFDFNQLSAAELARTQHLLNIRPRAVLDFDTPHARLSKLIGVALAA